MKYPFVLFLVSPSCEAIITNLVSESSSALDCTIFVSNDVTLCNKLCDFTFHVIASLESDTAINTSLSQNLMERFMQSNRWIQFKEDQLTLSNLHQFNYLVNKNYVESFSILDRRKTRPILSMFTSTYESYAKLERAYASLKRQSFSDWEWVIVDDSPTMAHFLWMQTHHEFSRDGRIRIYRRSRHSGSIGLVKNEAVALSRGDILVELDHDDELMSETLQDTVDAFAENPHLGFLYMDFINIYENGTNFRYSDFISFGYGGYYSRKIDDHWRFVYITPQVNNITASALISLPNHPRIWARECLLHPYVGNYCESLPICDDLDVLQRTILFALTATTGRYQMAKLNKVGYIQYMNSNGDNFSLLRNGEINRLGPQFISPLFYEKEEMHERFRQRGMADDESLLLHHVPLYKRPMADLEKIKYLNHLLSDTNQKAQIGIMGTESLFFFLPLIRRTLTLQSVRFVLLDTNRDHLQEEIWQLVDNQLLQEHMDVICLPKETTKKELECFFHYLYCSLPISQRCLWQIYQPTESPHCTFSQRHEFINTLLAKYERQNERYSYLEIGIENAYTFRHVNVSESNHQIGVDPSPQITKEELETPNRFLYRQTSDDFFKESWTEMHPYPFRLVFIDGMHQAEYVLRDVFNSIRLCSFGQFDIVLDDILPHTEKEQYSIPERAVFEDGIIKYAPGSGSWTGDVWKAAYWILLSSDKLPPFRYEICSHPSHRGMMALMFDFSLAERKELDVDAAIQEISQWSYLEHFDAYLFSLFGKGKK